MDTKTETSTAATVVAPSVNADASQIDFAPVRDVMDNAIKIHDYIAEQYGIHADFNSVFLLMLIARTDALAAGFAAFGQNGIGKMLSGMFGPKA